ncbi:MAG: alpha/beta hydrolase, partial [Acidimicrobiales bacterium]
MSPEQNPPQLRWRELSNAELEREYSPSSAIGGDFSQYVEAYIARSEAARTQCFNAGSTLIELRYGSDVSQSVDLVVPAAGVGPVPLLVFIHGGYWQLLSKRESFFAATACLDQGIAFAAVDYTLAPTASLDEIVNECRRALRLLGESATEYGYDQHRIFIAGSSAGAHLTAMAGLTSNESSTTTLGFAPAGLIL